MSISKERWVATGDPRSGTEIYDDEGFEITETEQGTVAFEFHSGFTADHAAAVIAGIEQRARDLRRRRNETLQNSTEHRCEIRDMMRVKIARRQYEAVPGVVIHHDGVIELPS